MARCPITRAIPVFLALAAIIGCGNDSETEEKARTLVQNTFESRVKPGPFATEALGKGVWFRAPAINGGCLQSKDWGHMDDPTHTSAANKAARRISPNYKYQNTWVSRTEKGWCVYLGQNLKLSVDQVNKMNDGWVVDYTLSMEATDGWFECVDEKKKSGYVRVVEDENGELKIADKGEELLELHQGACANPVPMPMERKGGKRPTKKPPQAPSKADAIAAAKRLDDALFNGDFEEALAASSCYNLYEKEPYGACAPSEFLNLGPLPRGGAPRMSDGPPWSQNAFKSLDALGNPKRDGKDPTMFHVQVKPAKGKYKARNMAIQWVDGEWKVVGVIGRLSEGLATAQIIYDLDRKDRRDIFERRMKGEQIGEDGLTLDAGVRYGYVEEGAE